jgi:RNA polymerase sigma-70 factor (ECF subfamily)
MASDPPAAPSPQGLPDPAQQASDHSLLRRFRRGSQDAATQLYIRYVHRLRALVRANCSSQLTRRLEPEDIVQSVFRRFFRRVLKGDYDVPPGEELWGLFLVIALNKIRAEEAFHRAGKRDLRLTITDGKAERLLAAQPGEDDAAYAALQFTVEEALERFSPQQRLMIELRIQGHGVAEIARQTGRSKRSVERALQEVRVGLRALLEEGGHDSAAQG